MSLGRMHSGLPFLRREHRRNQWSSSPVRQGQSLGHSPLCGRVLEHLSIFGALQPARSMIYSLGELALPEADGRNLTGHRLRESYLGYMFQQCDSISKARTQYAASGSCTFCGKLDTLP